MMAARSFTDDLAMSERPEVVSAIKLACHRYWPELLGIHKAHLENDKLGVDFWLEFPNGRMEGLDAKIRRPDFSLHGDDRIACLELLANTTTRKTGWTIDPAKRSDWIMFHYIESGRSIFYNARELRAAVIRFLPDLKLTGKPSTQRTGGYESTSLFVSHRDLWAAIYRHAHGKALQALAA